MQKQGKDLWKITYIQIQLQLFSFQEELFLEEIFLEKRKEMKGYFGLV